MPGIERARYVVLLPFDVADPRIAFILGPKTAFCAMVRLSHAVTTCANSAFTRGAKHDRSSLPLLGSDFTGVYQWGIPHGMHLLLLLIHPFSQGDLVLKRSGR
nr:unnamed protein product [Spirometra erinaceieuropaei]